MKDAAVIVVLLLLLASSHMLLSSRSIRARLVARLGEKRFLAAYSIVALMFFVPLFYHYFTHRHLGPQLWAVPDADAVVAFLELANAIGLVMLVAGLLNRGPAPFAGKPLEEPTGVHRITRHPVFMGTSVMALAHSIPNGHATDVAFFGGIAVFALVSCRYQDLRKLAAGDPAFKRFHAATSFLPFAGRGALRGVRELPPLAVVIGIVVAVAARCLHPSTGGCGVCQSAFNIDPQSACKIDPPERHGGGCPGSQ